MLNIQLISQLPGLIHVKNTHSQYLNVTQEAAELVGWNDTDKCYGKSDFDLPCKAAERADEFIKLDRMIFNSKKTMKTLNIQQYALTTNVLLTEKIPILNNIGECEGIVTTAVDVSDTMFFKAYIRLNYLDNQLHQTKLKAATYILSSNFQLLPLTKKQENCLFLLLRGKTIKEIGKILGLSPRTVEDHFDAIKIKLSCENKSALIEKAIDIGFLYYIPEEFQSNVYIDNIF